MKMGNQSFSAFAESAEEKHGDELGIDINRGINSHGGTDKEDEV
jgi:hypothetical protein